MQALATRLARVDLVGPITQTLWGHRLLAALVALYALGGWLIVASLGQTDHFTLFHYNGVFPLVTALCLGSFCAGLFRFTSCSSCGRNALSPIWLNRRPRSGWFPSG